MEEIKNATLIDPIIYDGNRRIITVANGEKLSNVFHHLPSGIVIKDETGMGATYLELAAARASIIVEPLKYTASSKARSHNAIYFGSRTIRDAKLTGDELLKKLNSLSSDKRKIVVVADSLVRLREILEERIKDYFLLIDEADSFQLDSTFRSSMGNCFDIYKDHPAGMRALLTATPIAFSEEKLHAERTTVIKYRTPKQRRISLVHCDNINGTLIDTLLSIQRANPGGKLMVAYNNLSGCLEAATHLIKQESYHHEDVRILCSSSDMSKRKAGPFFHELSGDTLPATINFVTSAYFTGFDLNEDYHLISVSDCKNPIFLLSDDRLKQISGRCRKNLLSETVIFTTAPTKVKIPLKDALIDAAMTEIKALECISRNYEDTPLLSIHLSEIRKYIITYTQDNGAQFVREDIGGKAVVNYLSIDASLEGYRIKKDLYQYREQLYHSLATQGHEVTLISQNSNVVLSKIEPENINKADIVNAIIDRILQMKPAQLAKDLRTNAKISLLESTIIRTYLDYLPYIEINDILKILKSLSNKDSRQFNRLLRSAFFYTLPENDNFKSRVLHLFWEGRTYTRLELFEIWNRIFADTGLVMNRKIFSLEEVVPFTNIHFRTTKDRSNRIVSKGIPLNIKITGTNPDGFTLIKYREIPNDKAKFNQFYS